MILLVMNFWILKNNIFILLQLFLEYFLIHLFNFIVFMCFPIVLILIGFILFFHTLVILNLQFVLLLSQFLLNYVLFIPILLILIHSRILIPSINLFQNQLVHLIILLIIFILFLLLISNFVFLIFPLLLQTF